MSCLMSSSLTALRKGHSTSAQCGNSSPKQNSSEISLPGRGSPYLTVFNHLPPPNSPMAWNQHGRASRPKRKMLPFACKKTGFFQGSVALPTFVAVQSARPWSSNCKKFTLELNDDPGPIQRLIYTQSSGHWQIRREWLPPLSRAGNSNMQSDTELH